MGLRTRRKSTAQVSLTTQLLDSYNFKRCEFPLINEDGGTNKNEANEDTVKVQEKKREKKNVAVINITFSKSDK